jgi:hypothetical protein
MKIKPFQSSLPKTMLFHTYKTYNSIKTAQPETHNFCKISYYVKIKAYCRASLLNNKYFFAQVIYVMSSYCFTEISAYVSEILALVAVNVDKLINISLLT